MLGSLLDAPAPIMNMIGKLFQNLNKIVLDTCSLKSKKQPLTGIEPATFAFED